MKKVQKIYCRIFQTGFKIAIPFLPYRKPKEISDMTQLPDVFKNENVERVLLVTDDGIMRVGLHQAILDVLQKANIEVTIFHDTHVNPTVDDVENGAKLYHDHHCQALLALGGGSAMDCAKGIGARLVRPHTPLAKMKGVLKVRRRLPLLIAVPTTAGTGSECTLAAVITNPRDHSKYAINDFPLIPKYALLDPHMTLSLPPFLTATTGMDALTHAIEAYIGRSTTKDTRQAALAAVHLIYENLPIVYREPHHLEARAKMAKAAYLAGLAFTKSYVGYVHALAHALGGFYGVAHGYANAVLLPVVLRRYGKAIEKPLKELAIAAGLANEHTPPEQAAEKMIASIETFNQDFQIGHTIAEIKEEDLEALCAHAAHEANPLYPVPVLMDAKELEPLYRSIMTKE